MLQIENTKTNLITNDELDFIEAIEEFIKNGNPELIKEVMSYFSEFCFNVESKSSPYITVSNDFIKKIINLVTNTNLIVMNKSYHCFKFFLDDWNRFSPKQKEYILSNLKDVFPKLQDTTSQMIIIEIIAQYIANKESLETLNNFKALLSQKNAKFLIPYGYRLLIEYASDKKIKELAWYELLSMRNDMLENVKIEVEHAINFIKKNVQSFQTDSKT